MNIDFTGEVSRWVVPPHCCEFIVQKSHRCCSVLLLLAAASTSRPSRGVSRKEARLETTKVTHPLKVTRLRLTRTLQVWMNTSLDRCKSKPKTQTGNQTRDPYWLVTHSDQQGPSRAHQSTMAVSKVHFCLLMAMCLLQKVDVWWILWFACICVKGKTM